MNFWEQLGTSLLGSLLAILTGLAIFYFTERVKRKDQSETNLKLLIRECEYDLLMLNKFKDELTKIKTDAASDIKDTFRYIRFGSYAANFAIQCKRSGDLYSKLNNTEISQLDELVNRYTIYLEQFVTQRIQAFKDGKLNKTDLNVFLNQQELLIEQDIPTLENLIEKLKK